MQAQSFTHAQLYIKHKGLNVSWSHFHSQSSGSFTCVRVMIQWLDLPTLILKRVMRYHSCKSLQEGRGNSPSESWQRDVILWLLCLHSSLWTLSRSKHGCMHSLYLGPAFELFVLPVTVLPQSCRSVPLSPLMLPPPRSPYILLLLLRRVSSCSSLSSLPSVSLAESKLMN